MAEGRPKRGPARVRKRANGAKVDRDVALVFGRSEAGLHVLRRRAATGDVEAGVVAPLREGRAITGEVVSLSPREDSPFLFDCTTDRELSAPGAGGGPGGGGPARVATDEYRRGWDAIWGVRARPARSADVN